MSRYKENILFAFGMKNACNIIVSLLKGVPTKSYVVVKIILN